MHLNFLSVVHAEYRPEIDGLRAIAVLAVIIYHFNAAWLPGGFTGVDVFFVISGYLITKQIQSDLVNQSFSLKAFYVRRIRRILPPLLVMLFVSTAVAFVLLTPEDLNSFSKSLLLQPLFLQNVLFLTEGEYFIGADKKPLLHTWSLAIEEQFYVFWPLVLFLTSRKKSNIWILGGLLAISFLINIYWSQSSPQSAFFMIFGRAWELGIGGLVAILESQKKLTFRFNHRFRNLMLCLGLLGLAISFGLLNAKMAFPGIVVLIPVIATSMLILFSSSVPTFSHQGIVS